MGCKFWVCLLAQLHLGLILWVLLINNLTFSTEIPQQLVTFIKEDYLSSSLLMRCLTTLSFFCLSSTYDLQLFLVKVFALIATGILFAGSMSLGPHFFKYSLSDGSLRLVFKKPKITVTWTEFIREKKINTKNLFFS